MEWDQIKAHHILKYSKYFQILMFYVGLVLNIFGIFGNVIETPMSIPIDECPHPQRR